MSLKLILLAVLCFASVYCQSISSLQDAKDLLAAVQKQKAELIEEIRQFDLNRDNIKNTLVLSMKEDYQKTGVGFGNRWRIQEEGTGSYEALVFRDMSMTNAGVDRRYAMFKDRYTDK